MAQVSELELISAPRPPSGVAGAARRVYDTYENAILGTLGVALFLGLWEWGGTQTENGKLFFSAPSLVVAAFVRLSGQGALWNDMWVSFQEFGIGYLGSVAVGIPLGIAMGWYRA